MSKIAVMLTVHARAGRREEVHAILRRMVVFAQGEDGTEAFVLHQAVDDPDKFFIYQLYRDQEALRSHSERTAELLAGSGFPELTHFPHIVGSPMEGFIDVGVSASLDALPID